MATKETRDQLGYAALIDRELARVMPGVLANVVRGVLQRVAAAGFPGAHHCYIGFLTTQAGVEVPARLLARYPERMVIVLQHQFRDLEVDAEAFAVTLSFDGAWERLRVPFAAVLQYHDPEANFVLSLPTGGPPAAEPDAAADTESDAAPGPEADAPAASEPPGTEDESASGGGRVLAFDPKRRRKPHDPRA